MAEVQTPSDTTFRVFDFNRVDESTGKPRRLHVEQALSRVRARLASAHITAFVTTLSPYKGFGHFSQPAENGRVAVALNLPPALRRPGTYVIRLSGHALVGSRATKAKAAITLEVRP